MPKWPPNTASINGVLPFSSMASIGVPRSRRAEIAAECPIMAALINAALSAAGVRSGAAHSNEARTTSMCTRPITNATWISLSLKREWSHYGDPTRYCAPTPENFRISTVSMN